MQKVVIATASTVPENPSDECTNIPIPVALLELSLRQDQAEDNERRGGEETDEERNNNNKNKKKSPPPCDDNDTSWAKFRKKTSPVVNASVVLFYGILSAMFIFGWMSLNSCTVNPLIPVYLIVAGSTGILTKAFIHTRNKYLFNVVILLVLFDLCWQAFGSYNVYSEYQPNYDPTNGQPYCHRVAYLLAFWIITIVYSLIGLFILLSGCYFLMRNTFRKS